MTEWSKFCRLKDRYRLMYTCTPTQRMANLKKRVIPVKGKRVLPSSGPTSAPRRRQRIPRRAKTAIALLSGALSLCIGIIGALGNLYLTQLRQNQFSKNVVFSQNYSLRNALLDIGEASHHETPEDISLFEDDPYLVLEVFQSHLVRLTDLRALREPGEDLTSLHALYIALWESPDSAALVFDLLVNLSYGMELTAGEAVTALSASLNDSAQYLCSFFGVAQDFTDTIATALSLTAHTAQVDVEPVCQLPEYPNGCESASAVSLLRSIGVDISLRGFVDEYLPKQDVRISFGCCYGPDPQQYYAGNPDAGQGGWGCFAPVIVSALKAALPQGSGYTVCNLSGVDLEELSLYLSFGVPVAVWTTTDGKIANEFYQWQSYDQTQTYLYPKNQHCVVLCGVRPDPGTGSALYRYMDPLTSQVEEMGAEQLSACYTSMGCQAVALLPDALADCICCA